MNPWLLPSRTEKCVIKRKTVPGISVMLAAVSFQIATNRVILLTESAEKPEEIDVRRAEEAKERALEQLRQKQSIQEYYHSSASLARAMARLKTSRQTAGKIRI